MPRYLVPHYSRGFCERIFFKMKVRDLPEPELKPGSSTLQADALPSGPPGKPQHSAQ